MRKLLKAILALILITILCIGAFMAGYMLFANDNDNDAIHKNNIVYKKYKEQKKIKRDSSKKHNTNNNTEEKSTDKTKKKEEEEERSDDDTYNNICSICGKRVSGREMCECDGTIHHRTCHVDAYTCPQCNRYGLIDDPDIYGCPYCGYPGSENEEEDNNEEEEYDYKCCNCGASAYYDDNCYPYCWICYSALNNDDDNSNSDSEENTNNNEDVNDNEEANDNSDNNNKVLTDDQ